MARRGSSRPRRSPAPEERQRDAERTRRALLDAALIEFSSKGRAGARVSEIAARAGVDKQLISYYFGGKDGLYRALVERWLDAEREFAPPHLPLADLVASYVTQGARDRDLARLLLRESIDDDQGPPPTHGSSHSPMPSPTCAVAKTPPRDHVHPASARLLSWTSGVRVRPTPLGKSRDVDTAQIRDTALEVALAVIAQTRSRRLAMPRRRRNTRMGSRTLRPTPNEADEPVAR